jgi:hypothetical protein
MRPKNNVVNFKHLWWCLFIKSWSSSQDIFAGNSCNYNPNSTFPPCYSFWVWLVCSGSITRMGLWNHIVPLTTVWLQQTVRSSCWSSMFNGIRPKPTNKRFNSAYLQMPTEQKRTKYWGGQTGGGCTTIDDSAWNLPPACTYQNRPSNILPNQILHLLVNVALI